MFSYRHAFHAGNHADVLKHMVLIQLLKYLNHKETPYMVIDTHAGAGTYLLDGEYATKSGEADSGIGQLWESQDAPEIVTEFLDQIRELNPSGRLRLYPGSPFLAEHIMREQDRLRLFEMHPTDVRQLQENFRKLISHKVANGVELPSRGKRVMIQRADGYGGLKALLPPPSRRALVLIDPSYEDKDDYRKVRVAVDEAQKRFATGTYAVWYPALARLEAQQLPERLKRCAASDWLHVVLSIGGYAEGQGLHSSGMFVINPPWTLKAKLEQALPWLANLLGHGNGSFLVQSGTAARAPKERSA